MANLFGFLFYDCFLCSCLSLLCSIVCTIDGLRCEFFIRLFSFTEAIGMGMIKFCWLHRRAISHNVLLCFSSLILR